MKIFLDTADYKTIQQWSYLIDGVTTNPTLLFKAGNNPTETVVKICSLLNPKPVSIEVTEQEPQEVYIQAKKIAQLASNAVVKIPCHHKYYSVIHDLVQENIPLNITLLFTLNQALLMCKLGVRYISPFVGRLDDIECDGLQLLYDIRMMIDHYGYQTELLAASLRHVQHLHEAILAGADCATVPPDLLQKASEHILTDKGMHIFDTDWKKLGIKQFPS